MTKEQFIKEIAAYVKKYAPMYDIIVYSPIIAQACLESAYGTSELGKNANNYFGLKYNASVSNKEAYIKIGSEQNPDGSYVSSVMKWCNFNNMESGVKGYFDFLFKRTGITRYNNLKNVADPKTYLELIKQDGYATSLKYVDNLLKVINEWNLTQYDNKEDKNMASIKINIDAGHGSNTAGKRTPDGYREHWANVKVASYFAKAMDRCGIAYTKTGWNDDNSKDDPDTSLSARQAAIKAAGCTHSISFHFNASGNGKTYNSAQGIETLISDKDSCVGDSLTMAKYIQAELIKGTKQVNRGVKRQALSMCNCSIMKTKAAVLIEAGFMTNKYEAELMQSDSFCKETAEEAARGFCNYVGVKYVEDGGSQVTPSPSPASATKWVYQSVDYSAVFDPTYYADINPDLKKVYGTNATKLFDHFCKYGMKEKRRATSTFNINVYAQQADLKKAFGINWPLYYKHYCQYGKKEGRKAV